MRRSPTRSNLAVLVPALLALAGAGCQAVRVPQPPLTASLAANEPDARLEFWHQLSALPVASNDDAFHALLLYFDGTDPSADFGTRVETLKSRGMLPRGFAGLRLPRRRTEVRS